MPDTNSSPVVNCRGCNTAVNGSTCNTCNKCVSNCCECKHCSLCNENRLTEEICSSCNKCTYNGCCECWFCDHCNTAHNIQTVSPCSRCEACDNCCECTMCSRCGNTISESDVCQGCSTCRNCCGCREGENISFFRAPTPPVFHTATRMQHKVNVSKRYIAAEIEVAGITGADTTSKVVKKWNGAIVEDGSLPGSGFEINTAPASGDLFLQQVSEICEGLAKQGGKVNKSCGLHVHIDARDYNFYDIRKLSILYEKIEDALFSLVAPSRMTSRYCQPCGKRFVKNLEENTIPKDNEKTLIRNIYGSDIAINRVKDDKYNSSRYNALNVHSWVYRGTIEFRAHQGSVNAEKIQNWGMLWADIIDYAFVHSEKEIKALKGDGLSILLSICATDRVREHVVARHTYFKERKIGQRDAQEVGE